jgi:hypothetical protein
VLQKLQGIILTKMTRICKRDGEDFGDYLKIVTLATNPQYHDTPSRIEGGAAALISYLAHECFQRETAGLYVKAKTGAQPFYEEFGFEHFFLDEKIETNSDDDESASGSGREIGVIRAKTKNTAQTKKSSSSSSSSSESERKVKAKEEARELSHRMRIETYNIKNLFPEEKLQLPMEPTPVEKPE